MAKDKTPPAAPVEAPPPPPAESAPQMYSQEYVDGAKKVIDALQAEKAALEVTIATQKATIETLQEAKAEADADEKLVAAKMALGLTRAQAKAVVMRQKTFDLTPNGKANAAKHAEFKAKKTQSNS